MSYQVEMVNLEELVSSTHQYRQFSKVFDFLEIEKSLDIFPIKLQILHI